jgi:hypothetical protein
VSVFYCGQDKHLTSKPKRNCDRALAAASNQVMIIPVEKDSDGYTIAEVMAYGKGSVEVSFQEEILKTGLVKTRKSGLSCPNYLAFEEAL